MAYHLGVDLGTTYTAAALARDGHVEPVTLGRSTTVPSVVFLDDDGGLVIGTAAQMRATTDPSRFVREFKRRVGDPVPILAGNNPVPAEQLMARLLDWVVTEVATAEGDWPARLAVTHPANWGLYKTELLQDAVRSIPPLVHRLVPEPVAAATFYAERRDLPQGAVVAVYDLGGGTFDAAVVRSEPHGFRIVGQPDGVERLGGIDFDHAVLRYVAQAAGVDLDALDPEADPAVTLAVTRLRQECVAAKEALSAETEVEVPVTLPDRYTEVRLTRVGFEAMIRPALDETIVALRRAIASARVAPPDVTAILLVGGSSRIPLVARLVSEELGRPVAVDARPKDATSMGAAMLAERIGLPTRDTSRALAPSPGVTVASPAVMAPQDGASPHVPPDPPPPPGPAPAPAPAPPAVASPTRRPRRRLPVRAAAVACIVLVGALAAQALQVGTGGGAEDESGPEPGADATSGRVAIDVPEAPTGLIATGLRHACALAAEEGATPADVTCWGDDDYGQASPPSGQLDVIDAGFRATCGIRFDAALLDRYGVPSGNITCWGDAARQASPPGSPGFFALSVGGNHGCAITARELEPEAERPDDEAPSGAVTCWGRDDEGQATIPESTDVTGVAVPVANEYVQVSAGGDHTCGLNVVPGEGGLVVCWGSDAFGQASPPGQDLEAGELPFVSVSAGLRHSCALTSDNAVVCWGDRSNDATRVPVGEQFQAVSAGGTFTCALRMDSAVTCWGAEGIRAAVPRGKFTSIDAGDEVVCGVRPEATIVCWGVGEAADAAPGQSP
ncbi:MAG: Hsp70 family protein [Acidimicrobiales bacterium]